MEFEPPTTQSSDSVEPGRGRKPPTAPRRAVGIGASVLNTGEPAAAGKSAHNTTSRSIVCVLVVCFSSIELRADKACCDRFFSCLSWSIRDIGQAGQASEVHASAAKVRQVGSRQEKPGDFQVKQRFSAREVAHKARQAGAERTISPSKVTKAAILAVHTRYCQAGSKKAKRRGQRVTRWASGAGYV